MGLRARRAIASVGILVFLGFYVWAVIAVVAYAGYAGTRGPEGDAVEEGEAVQGHGVVRASFDRLRTNGAGADIPFQTRPC